ncbi:CDP-alcohol phosphatidyltransferase family protein [Rhizobium sp. FY34]|uniref:CDP-alcohol phosphatidyltransferase family protein n=1 Tax=Rhizobium sp. FY34 TaxID=2562309 RepID=UPI0010C0C1D0|nr:CDP-alcohol phosphatidyltransferase family protein [Rhizobium sp. FY34]
MPSNFSVQRHNGSFIAAAERRVLIAIAKRLPGFVTPDLLTGFGVFGALVVLTGYSLGNIEIWYLWLANLGIVIHWLGDSLDGTVARVRGVERPKFGFFLDQTVDLIGNLLIAIGIGLSPWVRLDVALLMLTAYHMLAVYVLVYSLVQGEFKIDVAGFGPTEMRIGIVVLNLAIMTIGAPTFVAAGLSFTWCDVLLLVIFLGLIALFIFELISKARKIVE